jgi:hypothetical protein
MPDRWRSHRAIVDFSRAPPRTFRSSSSSIRDGSFAAFLGWNRWYFHFTLHDA